MPIPLAPGGADDPTLDRESLDGRRLRRFGLLSVCPDCREALTASPRVDVELVCPRCSATVPVHHGVVIAMPSRPYPLGYADGPSRPTDGWAAGITADMDGKSAAYVRKYERYSLASRGYIIRRELAMAMAGSTPGRVLEAGCGPGVIGPLLSSRGVDVHGVDLSAGQLETAASRDDLTLYVRGDLERLPYRDGAFDTVLTLGVLEYVERPAAVLSELTRVTAPGGRVVATLPNMSGLPRLWSHYVYIPVVQRLKRRFGRTVPSYSRSLYSLHGFARLLAEAGLRLEKAWYFDVSILPPPLDRMARDGVLELVDGLEARLQGPLRCALTTQVIVSARLDSPSPVAQSCAGGGGPVTRSRVCR